VDIQACTGLSISLAWGISIRMGEIFERGVFGGLVEGKVWVLLWGWA